MEHSDLPHDPGTSDDLSRRLVDLESELCAARDESARWQGRWRDGRREAALTLALHQSGCRDVDAALRLLDATAVSVDDAGAATGVDDAVAGLKTSRAYLFTPRVQSAAPNPGTTITANPTDALAAWLRGRDC